jgi:hypothetical protein
VKTLTLSGPLSAILDTIEQEQKERAQKEPRCPEKAAIGLHGICPEKIMRFSRGTLFFARGFF